MDIQCLFLEPTEFGELSLRRSAHSHSQCEYHNAVVRVGTTAYPASDYDGEPVLYEGNPELWPKNCDCGYEFLESDLRLSYKRRLYRRDDHFALTTTLQDAPVGSMWYADFYPWRGPDGHCLVVKTPGGEWVVDAPSWAGEDKEGRPWTRTGEPPYVSASPSIHILGRYHGWLRDGVLVSC